MCLMEKAYNVCIEMLNQRGYTIMEQKQDIMAIKQNKENVIVIFNNSDSFDNKSMKDVITKMKDEEVNHAIIVYKNKVTPHVKNILEQNVELYIELFSEKELQYNITKHRLQPVFDKLPEKDAIEFKKKYGIKIPVMKSEQPISRFYNYKKGDMIRIIRKDGYISYRIVK